MHDDRLAYNRRAVRPIVCVSEGWQLIKGDYWLFLGIAVVGLLIATIVPLYILMGPMMCGIHICLLRQQTGRRVSIEMLFDGFHYFSQSLIATMLFFVPFVIIVIAWYVVFVVAVIGTMAALLPQGQGQPGDPGLFLGAIVGIEGLFFLGVLGFYVALGFLILFVYPLIVDRELSGTEAAVLSVKAAFSNFWGVLGVVLLELLFLNIGTLFCLVGVIFVLPIGCAMTAIAYRQVFPADDRYFKDLRPDPDEWDDDDVDAPANTGIQTEPAKLRSNTHVQGG